MTAIFFHLITDPLVIGGLLLANGFALGVAFAQWTLGR